MSPLQIRDPVAARDWLAAGLALVRVGSPGPPAIRQGTPWLRAMADTSLSLPPAGVLVDLGRLLTQPNARVEHRSVGVLDKLLRSYEDIVIGRVAIDALRESASDAIHALPPRLRPVAIALFVEQLLDRVGFSGTASLDPGALRELDRSTGEEWVVRGSAALHGPAAELLSAGYRQLIGCFQRTGRLLTPADIAVLEQLEILELRSERLALRQVVDATSGLCRGLPRRMKPSRRRAGHVSTRLDDESAYPVGGFAAITTSGTLENLVPTELAFMERGHEVDLFDIRYAEGELLYYTRDETAFVRPRRRITLALSADLDGLRHRDPGLPYQTLILVLALVRSLIEQLVRWLDQQELSVRIALPAHSLAEESRILSLATAEWREAGLVTIAHLDASSLGRLLEEDTRRAPTDVVWIGSHAADQLDFPGLFQWSLVAQPLPVLTGPFGGRAHQTEDPWAAWRDTTRKLLSDLV